MRLNQNLLDEYLDSMNFLNEACIRYPSAISFGSGRPRETFFRVEDVVHGLGHYVEKNQKEAKNYYNHLGQYNMTNGIINEEVSKVLKQDQNIEISPDEIILVSGAQEGMAILCNTLFEKGDVLLVTDPSYVGFIGYAKIYGIEIVTIDRTEDSIDFDDLEFKLKKLLQEGKHPRAMYEIPDYHNPTGGCMSYEDRLTFLRFADQYQFYIIEDNPYGYFCYDGERIPTLKSLDKNDRVIYLESYSKTVFPSIRLACMALGQKINIGHKEVRLVEECKKVKSFITVNTSTLLQGMLSDILAEHHDSLFEYCAPKVEYTKKNRDYMADAIDRCLGLEKPWRRPKGGYFGIVEVPFEPDVNIALEGAEKFGVIFCPLSMFCMNPKKGSRKIRLAFSNMEKDDIEEGIERLGRLIRHYQTKDIQ